MCPRSRGRISSLADISAPRDSPPRSPERTGLSLSPTFWPKNHSKSTKNFNVSSSPFGPALIEQDLKWVFRRAAGELSREQRRRRRRVGDDGLPTCVYAEQSRLIPEKHSKGYCVTHGATGRLTAVHDTNTYVVQKH